MPTFAQFKLNFLTTRKDRSGRGGMYVGGIAESDTIGNAIQSNLVAKIDIFIIELLARYVAGGSKFTGFEAGVWSELLQEFNLLTTVSINPTMGTMRSRRAGRGI